MRLFIAFDVPSTTLEPLKESLAVEGINPVNHFHCTLKFLGEVSEGDLQWIQEKLKTIQFSPIQATLEQPGAFPNKEQPQVLWVGIEHQADIEHLAQDIDMKLLDSFQPTKDFTAHVTLARVKDEQHHKEITTFLDTKQKSTPFTIKDFHLYKSTLTDEGPIYEKVETYSSS